MGEASPQIVPSGETPLGPKLPLRLGRFTLCDELGAGGMATVYLARMQLAAGLERLVALKTIHPHLAREQAFVDMFLDEARIASHVTHPNVCATHDFGEVDGVYYLAMEYLLGEPVFDVINRLVERFDDVREVLPYLAARIIADACEGLHAAHVARGPNGEKLGIVHRDVSPQNLFLTYDGSVKVVDFGCAKAAERVAHTSTGVMKGKVGYAAPEQIKATPVDARADVWALGVCLWETLTLSPLFTRDTAVSTAMAVLEEEVESAADGRDWVSEEIAAIAGKALQRDRAERYQSAREMGRALRKFIADSGFTLESAELAEWMEFMFERQRLERAEQARRVREMDISSVAEVPLYEVANAADVELLESTRAPLEAVRIDEDDEEDEGTPAPEVSGPLPRQSRGRITAISEPPELPTQRSGRKWLLALLLLLLLAVGGWWANQLYEPAPWFLDLVGMEPAADTEPGATDDATPGAPEGQDAEDEADDVDALQDAVASPPGGEDAVPQDTTPAEPGDAPPEDEPADADDEEDGQGSRSGRRRRRGGGGGSVTTVVSGGGTTTYGGSSGSTSPSPPAPATPPPGTGHLSLSTSSGWALVYLGGRSLGRTPVEADIPTGTHRLRVLPYGEESAAETIVVHVEPNAGSRLVLDVQPP